MRKILFFGLLLVSIICLGQDSFAFSNMKLANIAKKEADSAYIKGNYTAAIQIYDTLLKEGVASEIYYNLGNSHYKVGDVARAILNYERALLLQPGNNDIRANLEIARTKTIDKIESTADTFIFLWGNALINCMSVNVWATWGIISFILFIITLYIFFFSKRVFLKKVGFIGSVFFLIIAICSNLFASNQKEQLLNRNDAIIMNSSVTVRSTPSEGGTSLFVLHAGRKVNIKDNSMKEWKEIRLEDGKVGWIPASTIEII